MERAVYRWEREGPIDGIEFDPFKSPYRPATRGEADRAAPPAVAVEHDQSGEEDPVTACEEGPSDFKSRVSRFEHQLLSRALGENRFNQRATAEALGLTYDQLRQDRKSTRLNSSH